MKSIKKRFDIMRDKYPNYSDFVVFGETVKDMNFDRDKLVKWFGKLVPKDDWVGCPEQTIIKHFLELTKKPLSRRYSESNWSN